MVLRLLLLPVVSLFAAMLVGGCSKREPTAGTGTATNTPQAERSGATPAAAPPSRGPAPTAPPATGAVIPDSGDVNATLNRLSLELRKHVVGTRSVPKNFEDFIAKSHVQAPPPPAGKKYAIQDQAVVLVKR